MTKFNQVALLEALSQIESGDADTVIGKDGERSRYQISLEVWRLYGGTANFVLDSKDKTIAKPIAWAHLNAIEYRLKNTFLSEYGLKPRDIYVAWNAGYYYYYLRDFKFDKCGVVVKERAIRFENLYNSILQQHNAPLPSK